MTEEPEDKDIPQAEHESAAEVIVEATVGTAIDKAIEEFVAKAVRGRSSPLARNTDCYNYLVSQLPVLKALLIKEIEA